MSAFANKFARADEVARTKGVLDLQDSSHKHLINFSKRYPIHLIRNS